MPILHIKTTIVFLCVCVILDTHASANNYYGRHIAGQSSFRKFVPTSLYQSNAVLGDPDPVNPGMQNKGLPNQGLETPKKKKQGFWTPSKKLAAGVAGASLGVGGIALAAKHLLGQKQAPLSYQGGYPYNQLPSRPGVMNAPEGFPERLGPDGLPDLSWKGRGNTLLPSNANSYINGGMKPADTKGSGFSGTALLIGGGSLTVLAIIGFVIYKYSVKQKKANDRF